MARLALDDPHLRAREFQYQALGELDHRLEELPEVIRPKEIAIPAAISDHEFVDDVLHPSAVVADDPGEANAVADELVGERIKAGTVPLEAMEKGLSRVGHGAGSASR